MARPMWASALRTPGTVRSSSAARPMTRFISGSEVPGAPFRDSRDAIDMARDDMAAEFVADA